jgi:hypothetical protein
MSISPLRAVGTGLVAGAAGTAAMTAAQTVYYKKTGNQPSTTPAEVGRRLIRGVLQRDVPEDRTDLLNNAMHVAYGTSWGAALGIVAGSAARRPPALRTGLAFALSVWGASLVELPLMDVAPPPWEWGATALATDLGFHLVYGTAAAAAFGVLNRSAYARSACG